jgi:GNAT superfamily N-acetyltransferase
MASQFRVVQLPRNYDSREPQKLLAALAQKSKTLRLESLQTNPEAFSSNYAREVAFDDAVWVDRLKNPEASTIVALEMRGLDAGLDDLEAAAEARWVGVSVLMGPRTLDGTFPPSNGDAFWKTVLDVPVRAADAEDGAVNTLVYVINAVYVVPSARHTGLGKRLIEKAVDTSREEFQKDKSVGKEGVCMVFVQKNGSATGLYLACGFEMEAQSGTTGQSVGLMKRLD